MSLADLSREEDITMKVNKPIYIIGCSRSGSGIYHRMFSTYPNVPWLGLHTKHLSRLEIIRYLTYFGDIPVIGPHLRGGIDHGVCYALWEKIFHGFSTPTRLLAEDVTKKNKKSSNGIFSNSYETERSPAYQVNWMAQNWLSQGDIS